MASDSLFNIDQYAKRSEALLDEAFLRSSAFFDNLTEATLRQHQLPTQRATAGPFDPCAVAQVPRLRRPRPLPACAPGPLLWIDYSTEPSNVRPSRQRHNPAFRQFIIANLAGRGMVMILINGVLRPCPPMRTNVLTRRDLPRRRIITGIANGCASASAGPALMP